MTIKNAADFNSAMSQAATVSGVMGNNLDISTLFIDFKSLVLHDVEFTGIYAMQYKNEIRWNFHKN